MGLFGEKNPVFVDLDRGICGTFKGTVNQGVEAGYVFIEYVKFNSIRAIRYASPTKSIHIHHVYPHGKGYSSDNEENAEKEIVIVYRGEEGGAVNFIDNKNLKTIEELKSRIHDLEVENAGAKQRAEEAYSGAERVVTRAKQMSKTVADKDKMDPFNPLRNLNDNW